MTNASSSKSFESEARQILRMPNISCLLSSRCLAKRYVVESGPEARCSLPGAVTPGCQQRHAQVAGAYASSLEP